MSVLTGPSTTTRTSPVATTAALAVLRLLGAGLLVTNAAIHGYLWNQGYRTIPTIGHLFLLDAIAASVLALVVLGTPRRWLPIVAILGAGLEAGTVGGLFISTKHELFGFIESTQATLYWQSAITEVAGALVLVILAGFRLLAGARQSGHNTMVVTLVEGEAEQKLRVLYDEHAAALLGFALRLTAGDRGRAEDIVQDTLLRAWQNRDAFQTNHESMRPWLFTVARRISIDQHRRRTARPTEVGGTRADIALMSAADADEVEAGLDRIVVLDALSALSVEHRDVLMQTFYAGRSVADAAQRLGVPVGTVKSRTFYALKALRLALTERGVIT